LVATVLGALSADFFYLTPVGSFTGLAGGGFWLQVLFVLQGALITSLAQALHLSRQRAEKSTLEIQRHQEKLAERERQLQSLVGRMIEAQEEERRRVAYEVHDGFTQMAAAAYRRLTLLAEHHPPEDAQELAQEQHKRTEEGAPRGEPLPHRRESGTTVAYQRRTTTTIAILEAPVPPSEGEG
jgi:signal transduction histidine kinase